MGRVTTAGEAAAAPPWMACVRADASGSSGRGDGTVDEHLNRQVDPARVDRPRRQRVGCRRDRQSAPAENCNVHEGTG